MKKNHKGKGFKKGITLIELIAAMVILSIGIVAILSVQAHVTSKAVVAESMAVATFYAQEAMEKVRMSYYTDVDALAVVDVPAPGYQRTVTVSYCQLSGITWVTSASVTDYKRVTVTVSKTGGFIPPVRMVTIISDY